MSTGPCCFTLLMTDSSNQLQHTFPQSFAVASESFSIRLLKELRIKGEKNAGARALSTNSGDWLH